MKRKRNPWVAFLVFSLGLAALTLACREKEAPLPPDTRAEDERALRDSDAQWSKAAGAKDVERFVSFFADDSSELPPNGPMVTGKEAIRKWASELVAQPGIALSWQPTKVEVSRTGDIGYEIITYQLTVNNPKGKPVTDHGKGITVWEKQSGGSWKVVADTFNSDLPAAGAATH